MTEPEKFLRDLRCELSDQELADRADELAEIVGQSEQLDLEKKANAASCNSRLKLMRMQAAELAEQLRLRSEVRAIECVETPGSEPGWVDLIRTDTGECVRSRELTDEERQGRLLPLAKPPEKPAAE